MILLIVVFLANKLADDLKGLMKYFNQCRYYECAQMLNECCCKTYKYIYVLMSRISEEQSPLANKLANDQKGLMEVPSWNTLL